MAIGVTPKGVIHVDIVDKPRGEAWRIIGTCPTSVTPSGGIHVYAGPQAAVRDCETDEILAEGSSLHDVLDRLARITNMTVTLDDEVHPRNRMIFTP